NVDLYSGIPLIYEMCDGNPRTLLNLFDNFKNLLYVDENSNTYLPIDLSLQSAVIKSVSESKLENIKNHPDANAILSNSTKVNLGDILTEIGAHCFNGLVRSDFTMDPIGAFIIDKKIDPKIVELLKVGLNLG